ncbi:MAG: preprotein translocase subunit SecE [Deltaproteobacteria bacterium]|nr:preprotein translocase subunit SecE [Deltaproteobacteria bacterium]
MSKKTTGETGPEKKTASMSESIAEFKEFFELSKKEMRKVVWPDRKETIATCGAVLVLVVVVSVFLGTMDFALTKIVAALLS